MASPKAIRADELSYRFRAPHGVEHQALRDVSFDVGLGEVVGVVGPSGAGKSTLLNIVSNLLPADSGSIAYPSFDRLPRIGYMFQSNSAFPWRTVEQNLTYALQIRGESRPLRARRANELCRLVGMDPARYLCKYPKELSGGELRRVELGMALADSPQLILIDEPTSAVDWITRRQLQSMIQELVVSSGATVIFVTHDIEESVWLSDRVLALHDGTLADSIDVDLPRPRTDEMRTGVRFKQLMDQVICSLTNGVRHATVT